MAEATPTQDGKDENATKLWEACTNTPWDFDTWMALIPYLERGGEPMRPQLREAYVAFLAEFPLCYGYWDKLAKFEKAGEGGVDAALKVYEQGLAAIPCVELYVSYCGCAVDAAGPPAADGEPTPAGEVRAREIFDSAVAKVGGEWKSQALWDFFVRFEEGRGGSGKDGRVGTVIFRAASLPTGCAEKYMGTLRTMLQEKEGVAAAVMGLLPEADKTACAAMADTEEQRQGVTAAAERVHEGLKAEIQKRAPYEDKIQRPYFHVKPLAIEQRDNWHAYLDETVAEGNGALALKLFERCLVPCALYVEFWEKYAAYLEEQGNMEGAREVLVRGCRGPFKRRPDLKLQLALLEEALGNAAAARELYVDLTDKTAPASAEVAIRFANFERRCLHGAPPGADDKVSAIYEAAIKRFVETEDVSSATFLSIHFATMLAQVVGDMAKARGVLEAARSVNPASKTLLQASVHLELSHGGPDAEQTARALYLAAIDEGSSMTAEDKREVQTEYVDFEHDRGADVKRLRTAQAALRVVLAAKAQEDQRAAARKRPASAQLQNDPKRGRPAAAAAAPAYTAPPPQQGYDEAAYQQWYAQQGYQQQPYAGQGYYGQSYGYGY